MYEELKGKKALITGATKGIGRGIAEKFSSLGINSVLNYSNDDIAAIETEEIIKGYGIEYHFVKADVSDPDDIRRLFSFASEKFGQLDIVVANAGIELIETPVLESTESDFDKVFDLNVKGTFFVMQEAAKCLANNGRLILISSTMSIHPDSGAAIYAASKAASKLFVDVLAKELGPRHINVNSVMPGIIDNAGVITDQPIEIKKQMMAGSPFNRLGTPEDVAKVVAFLASDEGAFVHGHHLQVNGGSIY
ncbi:MULTISPECIES: SDR family NAD(P)-dependent oxidoreductase [Mesonia]|uniref:Glucose 1-dehydrogenase 2 n=1 Tax=Mesonia oceanica TaxID=2687242 RepID=A0AC61YE61_9FLAO|nr:MULTISPECIES: SDR family oxidoreductase [Mesonia]MAN26011.1 short-chain dehydrogenase [Mesonia sp.]MAQ41746.1 short-chain dehydrogenase [Mesonia sp.]MBJ98824.1 short-chain dehydrogenase [Flavobacteriaceae bacterium]VVV02435.1 Glucose 1-dehydrogenase 2 [Mesonia oceanica]|tara:strand:+ start:7180 stop:7929 length:750 start_codon:yes stop_codon:yes gene_type:complete